MALGDPKTDRVSELRLVVRRTVSEVGNGLSGWCGLLITTLDVPIEIAGGFIRARTRHFALNFATVYTRSVRIINKIK